MIYDRILKNAVPVLVIGQHEWFVVGGYSYYRNGQTTYPRQRLGGRSAHVCPVRLWFK